MHLTNTRESFLETRASVRLFNALNAVLTLEMARKLLSMHRESQNHPPPLFGRVYQVKLFIFIPLLVVIESTAAFICVVRSYTSPIPVRLVIGASHQSFAMPA